MTELDLAVLRFEKVFFRHPGAKDQAIRETFDLSANGYYQILNRVIDDPAALPVEPVTVNRLRRLRDERRRRRTELPI